MEQVDCWARKRGGARKAERKSEKSSLPEIGFRVRVKVNVNGRALGFESRLMLRASPVMSHCALGPWTKYC